MKKFNVGNRIIKSKNLELATNSFHYKQATATETVVTVTEDFFSPYEIDFNSQIAGSNMFKKCFQETGVIACYGNGKYYNLDLNKEEVKLNLEERFTQALKEDRDDSDKKIEKLEKAILQMQKDIDSLKNKSQNEDKLNDMKQYIFNTLKLS